MLILRSSNLVRSATEHKNMKVKILRDVMVAGVRKDSGSTVELDDNVAQLLIGQRQAEEYVEPAIKKAAPAAKKVAAATPKVQPSTPKKETA